MTVPSVPSEMRDLLIRLDEKVQNGFASITAKLDAMDRRADTHEQRLHTIEMELADRPRLKAEFDRLKVDVDGVDARLSVIETTGRVAGKIGGWIWAIGGGGLVAMAGFLIRLFVTHGG